MALIELAESRAITVLLANVPSELRIILMIYNPKTLEDANTLVLNNSLIEQQINSCINITKVNHSSSQPQINNKLRPQHTIKFNSLFQPFQMQKPHLSRYPSNPNFRPNFNQNTFNNTSFSTNKFPSQPIYVQPKLVQHNFPTTLQLFGQPYVSLSIYCPPFS